MSREEYSQAYSVGFESTVRLLLSRGADRDRAREASQAAWAKGWECRHQLRQPRKVLAWVNTIALNIFRNLRRHPMLQLSAEPRLSWATNIASAGLAGAAVAHVLDL